MLTWYLFARRFEVKVNTVILSSENKSRNAQKGFYNGPYNWDLRFDIY